MGVDVFDLSVGLRLEDGCRTSSDKDGSAREDEDGGDEDASVDTAVKEGAEDVVELSFVLRPCGGGLSLQSWPSSGDGTKPPDGLG